SRLRFLPAPRFSLGRFLFHPLVELRLLEAPAIAQLESRNFLFPYVLVKCVRTHSQVLRRLANIHHFSRVGHRFQTLFTELTPFTAAAWPLGSEFLVTKRLRVNSGVPSIYQPRMRPA